MNCKLFANLTLEQLDRLQSLLPKPETFAAGDELFRMGHLGIITVGRAKIFRTAVGHKLPVRVIGEGDVIGAVGMFGSWKEGASSVRALSACKVQYISREMLDRIFAEFPVTVMAYIEFLTDRIRFLNRGLDTFSAETVEMRLYEYLHSHADQQGQVLPMISMAELARRLKIGRSSLYRAIGLLEQNHLIRRDKKVFTVL